ncbi:aminoglycoside 2'-N-acetyltransferase I [Bradyrhizobium sp. i1.3.6]
MSIEIDILNGDASWRIAQPLLSAVWGRDAAEKPSWSHVKWANADLRVLIETPEDGLVCHVGIYFRTVTWNGQKVHIGGIGGVCTREDRRGRGYATMAIDAAIHTMRANEAVRFGLLFSESNNFGVLRGPQLAPLQGRGLLRAAGGSDPLRLHGALRLQHRPRADAGHHRPMRPALVSPA